MQTWAIRTIFAGLVVLALAALSFAQTSEPTVDAPVLNTDKAEQPATSAGNDKSKRNLKRKLRRKTKPAPEKPAPKPKLTPEQQRRIQIKKELVEKITGAWAFITTADQTLDAGVLENAVKRCLAQMPLKNLQFEKEAQKTLPDIDGLFGDVVYFPTETGIQRLDINSGQVLLIKEIAKQELSATKVVWGIRGARIGFRIRFTQRLATAKKLRFMLEENNLYLRCPLKNEPFESNQ